MRVENRGRNVPRGSRNARTRTMLKHIFIYVCLLAFGACEGRSSASHASRAAISRRNVALNTRGGSSRNKKRTSERESPHHTDPPGFTGDAINQYKPNKLPTVEALLMPRRLNLRMIIQGFCFAALFVSFGACVATSGSPYSEAVFQIVYKTAPAPPNYQPTRTELFLAQKLAAVSKDILPPLFLPTALPLLSLLGAMAVWLGCCILCPQWFMNWNILLNYKTYPIGKQNAHKILKKHISDHLKYSNHYQASVLVNIPQESRVAESNRKPKLVLPLHLSEQKGNSSHESHETPYYFDLNHRRMYTDLLTSASMDGGPKGHLTKSLKDLTCTRTMGLRTRPKLRSAQERYGPYASISLPEPTLAKALQARLTSPLSVLQLIGKLLQALEESLATSLLGIAGTIAEHWLNARQAIVSAKELAQEVQGSLQDVGSQKVWALRPGGSDCMEWAEISSVELLPGDLFLLATADMTMPVDALLLDGTVVTNEAVLTGESVPQAKMPLEEIDSQRLDMMGRHRGSVLFAGTTVLFHNNDRRRKVKSFPKVPKKARNGVQCLVLRTGSYSSRGDLMRALSKSRVGAISNPESEKDALKLVLSLSVFAVIACWSLLWSEKQESSTFRRIIQCTRIGIASIPSNIPMALSAIAQSCAAQLRKDSDVVCSEPGALLTAATIDAVVFDKTGTLTADTQSLSAIVPPESCSPDIKWRVDAILGGCHSLITLKDEKSENKLIGDPLDLASLRYSGWIYSQMEDCYTKMAGNCKGTKLWQVKTFPFDPTRRTSSAILLVTDPLDNIRIMKVIKGSPDMIEHLVDHDTYNQTWYQKTNAQLGKEGMRTIALAFKELALEDHIIKMLFPDGVPSSNAEIALAIKVSRQHSHTVHREDVEKVGFDFAGFACFIASIRPSTKRIINEFHQAGIPVTMLTGDSIEAAITTSRAAGLIKAAATAVLDVDGGQFIWKIEDNDVVKSRRVTQRNWSRFRSLSNRNRLSLILTGNAVELLQSASKVSSLLASIKNDLSMFTVIARASPKQKEYAISSLKNEGGKTVLMCGDGVNDVAAMKLADVSVALLNGYGDEKESTEAVDTEDARRRRKVSEKRIGSNRRSRQADDMSRAGVGESRTASLARIKTRIENAMLETRQKAADRQGTKDTDSGDTRFASEDILAQFAAISSIVREERERSRLLQKGGAGAARILSENERKRQQLNATADLVELSENFDIKPGEASLASPFSCLRPAIDGVDGLIRVGVAASACALSTQQGIALNCLMAAYNLATLYRDGFRYGKHMFTVEMMFCVAIDQAGYKALCTPRPHLSSTRAPASLFHPSSILSVIGQALVHLMARNFGVRIAKSLEDSGKKDPPMLVRYQPRPSATSGERRHLVEALADALSRVVPTDDMDKDWFGRPKFRPNYATNVVFLFSIFQSGVTAIVNHKGKPFCGSFLESRNLSVAVCAAFLGSVVGISGTFPVLNAMLELKPLPSRGSRYWILSLFLFDIAGCWLINRMCTLVSSTKAELVTPTVRKSSTGEETAADLEARLLKEEETDNRKLVMAIVAATIVVGLL